MLDESTTIKELEQDKVYKYLGIDEGNGIQHSKMKEKLRKEYYRRVRLILKSELNARNKIEAINTLAVPVLQYSFNVINWRVQEIINLDTKTRKFLTMAKMHHPRSDVSRLYLQRKEGGRGLIQLELAYKTTTIGLYHYLKTTADPLLQIVKKSFSIKTSAEKYMNELDMPTVIKPLTESSVSYAKRVKLIAREKGKMDLSENWKEKPLHGKYPKRIDEPDVDSKNTHQWLRSSGLKAETEGLLVAAQDQSLNTRSYSARITKTTTEAKCRLCGKFEETVGHIVSGCPTLATSEYTHRHNKAAAYIHWSICKGLNIAVPDKWYEHQPNTVESTGDYTVLWDMPIQTDRTIPANRPDIIVKDRKSNTCTMIDMSVPIDRNISTKYTEKKSKYKDLEIEVERMWHMRATTTPVIIGALGTVKKGLEASLRHIPGEPKLFELQKTVLLGTAHILRKTLSLQT